VRIFEWVLFVFILAAGLRMFIPLPRSWRQANFILLAGLGGALLLHLLLEGSRWQMIPLYVLAGIGLLYLMGVISGRARPGAGRTLPALLKAIFIILTLLFSLPPLLLPVPRLPQPTGPYPVGTTSYEWVDEGRVDPYSGGPRRLTVQAWYPAEVGAVGVRAPYFAHLDLAGPVIAREFNLPTLLFNHFELVKTHSLEDAAIGGEAERFPVLLFSHGWTGIRGQSTFLMQELASQGYVVLSPDHTHGAALAVFSDGQVVLNYAEALPSGVSQEEYDRSARLLGQTWAGDLAFLLDQAERMDRGEVPSLFQNRLDLDNVGALGHSTGGGAAVEFCYTDSRCKAGLPMDAWMIPYDRAIPAAGLQQPFLFIFSESWSVPRNPALVAEMFENAHSPSYRVMILGTSHYDFADLPMISPAAHLLGFKGPLPTRVVMEIVNRYAVAFFERALQQPDSYRLDDLNEALAEFVIVERQGE
jgi:dienelactone hydrolase